MATCRGSGKGAVRPVGSLGFWVVVSLAAILALTSEAHLTQAAQAAEAADWQSQWEEAVAGARKEGRLTVAGGGEIGRSFRKIFPTFGKKFGIEVTLSATRGGQEANRILAEKGAGVHSVDVFMGGVTNGEELIRQGALDPMAGDFILPEVNDQSLWWDGRHHYGDQARKYIFLFSASPRGAGLLLNTKMVDPKEITSLWDLLKPKYRGQIIAGYLGTEGQAGSVAEYYGHPKLGPEWIEKLFMETDIAMIDDTRTAKDWVITGRKAIAIFVGATDDMYAVKEAGAPIEIMDYRFPMKEGNILAGGGSASMVMLVAKPPHPNARKVFINWWLSKEGQLAIHNVYGQRQSFRLDIPNDMLRPEAKIHKGVDYVYPQSDPNFMAVRGEALKFTRELAQKWKAKQR
ncbi:MAG TPA: extracellular solute-binding protein [Candidatus Binatia bacterium]